MDHWPAIWWLFALLKTLCLLYFVGFAVWIQHAGDLLGIVLFCMCIKDIFRNSLMCSYIFIRFFRQHLSTLCTVSIVFLLFPFLFCCLFFQTAHLPLRFCVRGNAQNSHLEVLKSPSGHLTKEDILDTVFWAEFQIGKSHFSLCLKQFCAIAPLQYKELSHFTIKYATFQYSSFEKCFGICWDRSYICFVSVVVCFTSSPSN